MLNRKLTRKNTGKNRKVKKGNKTEILINGKKVCSL